MPFINVKTNTPVSQDKMQTIKSSLGQAITAIPGKSESWLMVGIEPDYALWFKGSDAPAAMVEVSVYGGASPSAYSNLTAQVTDILNNSLGISPDRIYVKYFETPNWGWNGSNF
jgi:phenylpyruvate tautomerase PptA (4-oxalocrotonate tautomerase family)